MTESIVYSLIALAFVLLLISITPIRAFIFHKPWLTILTKNLYTFIGKPYFKVSVFHHREIGQVGVDAQYNIHFLYRLDSAYEAANVEYYNRGLSEEAKVAIYLYDTMGSIAENYMPMPSELRNMDEEAEPMSLRDGGDPVKQVVDLAKSNDEGGFDIARG